MKEKEVMKSEICVRKFGVFVEPTFYKEKKGGRK